MKLNNKQAAISVVTTGQVNCRCKDTTAMLNSTTRFPSFSQPNNLVFTIKINTNGCKKTSQYYQRTNI